MKHSEVSFQFTGRYFTLGTLNSQTKSIWFVLHGYGQLAEYFIRKFSVLEQHHIYVVAPEGLSKFYLQSQEPGTSRASDRVGASWMTKENRLTDINNYITFLNTVYEQEIRKVSNDIPVTVLGFSQGSATACRWLLNGSIKVNQLIIWAGVFPADMELNAAKQMFADKELIIVYGLDDKFLNDIRFQEINNVTKELSNKVKVITFNGGHEIDKEALQKIIKTSG